VGVYLGRSPQHAKNVALVLSLETGLVSPQFHCKLDSTFQTLQEYGNTLPKSKWQLKAGFIVDKTSRTSVRVEREQVIPADPAPVIPSPQQVEADPIPQGIQKPERDHNHEGLPPLRRS